MREVLKTAASLSLSGSLAILVLLVLRPLLRERFRKRWQYYIWLIAVFRLLLPLSPEFSPVGALFREVETPAAVQAVGPRLPEVVASPRESPVTAEPARPVQPEPPAAPEPKSPALPDAAEVLALVWLGGALLLLVWKVAGCRSFSRCLRAGCRAVEDPAQLDLLSRIGEELGVRRPVELYENPLAASPMLLGLFRPCVVLPSAAVAEADFRHTVLHELTHYRRRDLLYKWLVQLTVCLHWFNPLVWVMAREIDRACELSCDEAVLQALAPEERRAYGDTLLRALETGGGYHAVPGSAGLGESAELLKERLSAIMKFKKSSKWTALLSLILAAALTTGATAAGAYTGPAKRGASTVKGTALPPLSAQAASNENLQLRSTLLAERSYAEGDIATFSVAVPFLSEEAREEWLERCYEDGNSAFFSVLVHHLDWDTDTLDAWIARTSKANAAFLSILLQVAERDAELEALEEEFATQQTAEYKAAGITREDRAYYYQGKLVRIFLDLRPDASCVALETNPKGVLDIRVERGADGNIQTVREMTKAEVEELFGDWEDPEEGDITPTPKQGGSSPALSDRPDGLSMTVEELPAAARKAMDQCAVRTWYVIHSEGRQYLYCNGFPWRYAWEPTRGEGVWRVKIQKGKKLDAGYVLLSFSDDAPLIVTLEGEPVRLTDIQA